VFYSTLSNDYLIEKNGEIGSVDELDLSDTSVDIVVATLKRFYGEIRKADGTLYAKKSMITLRFGLQKHFLKSRQEDSTLSFLDQFHHYCFKHVIRS
jgi:hypothetical protein